MSISGSADGFSFNGKLAELFPDARWVGNGRLYFSQAAARRLCSGKPCGSPAMANGRCRLHGGKSTGPRTAEGLERMRRAKTKHGLYSAETLQLMRASGLQRHSRRVVDDL